MRRLTLLVLFAGAVMFAVADQVSAHGRCGGGCHRGHRGHRCGHGHRGHHHGHCGHGGHCGPAGCGALPADGHHHAYAEAPATFLVHLPADAVLTVDDQATTLTSAVRLFRTPNLQFGQDYVYTLRARVGDQTMTQQVTVRAGEQTTVRFEPTTAVAQR